MELWMNNFVTLLIEGVSGARHVLVSGTKRHRHIESVIFSNYYRCQSVCHVSII